MAHSMSKTSDDQAKSSVEEGNSQSQQQDTLMTPSNSEPPSTDQISHTRRGSSKNFNRPRDDGEVIIPSEKYDPEDPLPYFLSQEAKQISEIKGMKSRPVEEFRAADVDNLLSFKSICCWSLLTILLVGGSLVAVAFTVDWNAEADGDADISVDGGP